MGGPFSVILLSIFRRFDHLCGSHGERRGCSLSLDPMHIRTYLFPNLEQIMDLELQKILLWSLFSC